MALAATRRNGLAAGQERLDALEVGQEPAFGDGGYVRSDATLLLGLAAPPDDAALH